MSYLGNTLLFLDTGFFKSYKSKDPAYGALFKYSTDGSIILCTSHLCLEEWRTQKARHFADFLNTARNNLINQRGNNFFASELLSPEIFNDFTSEESIGTQTQTIVDEFIKKHNIRRFPPKLEHVERTWNSYFHGMPPFKEVKNAKDIPDAWIFEVAKDALGEPEYRNLSNKFCIAGDGAMRSALTDLGFSPITLAELIDALNKDGQGVGSTENLIATSNKQPPIDSNLISKPSDENSNFNDLTPLDKILSTALNPAIREIYLRLLGYTVPLDAPTHQSLWDAVASKGFDLKLVQACAVMLSDTSKPYLKDTGNHYIVGDKEICNAAADRLTQEIIELLDH